MPRSISQPARQSNPPANSRKLAPAGRRGARTAHAAALSRATAARARASGDRRPFYEEDAARAAAARSASETIRRTIATSSGFSTWWSKPACSAFVRSSGRP